VPLDEVIDRAIANAIALNDGSIPKAAAALKVSPSTIYRRRQARG
jgi:transcriptional regulator of acetoin/glycerol metabolism